MKYDEVVKTADGSYRVPPKFCPACGAALRDTKKSIALMPVGRPGAGEDSDEVWGWDTYCVTCDWSGDISPDAEWPEARQAETS